LAKAGKTAILGLLASLGRSGGLDKRLNVKREPNPSAPNRAPTSFTVAANAQGGANEARRSDLGVSALTAQTNRSRNMSPTAAIWAELLGLFRLHQAEIGPKSTPIGEMMSEDAKFALGF
jgi:hypothetical protein